MDQFNSDVMGRLEVATRLLNERRAQSSLEHHPVGIFEEAGYAPPDRDSDWRALARLADHVQALYTAITDGDGTVAVAQINRELLRLHVIPQLEPTGRGTQLHFHTPDASFAGGWAAGITAALAIAYNSGEIDRIGACVDPDCRNYFLDRGRNRQRRFCSLRCQNRAKSAAYRDRLGRIG